ncbi:MAG: amidohydrolase [Rhodobiaceae bacterium]|nr:amidohydrolase [Rhodobiaceae bacterium]
MKIACVQMTSACDPADNLPIIAARVKQAAAQSARLVALPETCSFMEKNRKAMHSRLENQADSQVLAALCHMAKENGIFLLIGSMILAEENSDKAVNRSLLIAPNGTVQAQYDKIHMFDVALENGESHHESAAYQAGDKLVVTKADGVSLGLSICYDLRFPALYRRLAEAQAQVIFVPSAFTKQTGAAHWHILLRARAIETGCFIVAPAQIGVHENGRETYGHSLIIDPWGKIIAEAASEDKVIVAALDMTLVDKARRQIPALFHGATYRLPEGRQGQD